MSVVNSLDPVLCKQLDKTVRSLAVPIGREVHENDDLLIGVDLLKLFRLGKTRLEPERLSIGKLQKIGIVGSVLCVLIVIPSPCSRNDSGVRRGNLRS